jgi:hypothetical protein
MFSLRDDDRHVNKARLPAYTGDLMPKSIEGGVRFSETVNIASQSSVSGWFVFQLPEYLTHDVRIEKYKLVSLNTRGSVVAVETMIMREICYEKES